jgi:hypothetical protein
VCIIVIYLLLIQTTADNDGRGDKDGRGYQGIPEDIKG